MRTTSLSEDTLQAAIQAFESQIKVLHARVAELKALLPLAHAVIDEPPSINNQPQSKKRVISAAGRKRMAAAQKKRWDAYNAKKNLKTKAATA